MSINRSINQSAYRLLVSQSVGPVSQSVSRLVQSVGRSVYWSVSWSVGLLVCPLVSQSVSRLVYWSVSQSVGLSVVQSVGLSVHLSVGQSVDHLWDMVYFLPSWQSLHLKQVLKLQAGHKWLTNCFHFQI